MRFGVSQTKKRVVMQKNLQQRYLDFLRSKNLKSTAQRSLILDVVLHAQEHLTAEDVHARARDIDSSLGLATVYRNLKLMEEAGLVVSHNYEQAVTRYEILNDDEHHDHLICERCGAVMEVLDQGIELLQKRLAERHGFELSGHRMYLYGLCPECRRKEAMLRKGALPRKQGMTAGVELKSI